MEWISFGGNVTTYAVYAYNEDVCGSQPGLMYFTPNSPACCDYYDCEDSCWLGDNVWCKTLPDQPIDEVDADKDEESIAKLIVSVLVGIGLAV
eukprot:CAMPEP_0168553150 /NCGR_PEP_ID=MMETSP0413-20121227/7099_1 /TAXON_ID=136452 /ORGANISM="Filamoeba nolandi, Strain NC-AS-23-1" /LENGTH=92 /DNA_ID=CAMNT_0008583817 /DNA_START=311 /DNA_END=586 /DNA_ORIENTATION=+